MKYHVEFDVDFKRNPYRGTYIALEGIDGSGKTFQTDILAKHLIKQGKSVHIVREPRKEEGILADLIQKILRGEISMSPVALQYLFTADRIMNQDENVIPALKAGKVVISDRSFWSIIPYALPDMGEDFAKSSIDFMLLAQGLLSLYHKTIVPDHIFFLEVSVDTAVRRLSGKAEIKEIYEKRDKIEKHYKGYHWILDNYPKEFMVLDGEQTQSQVTRKLIQLLQRKL